MTTANEVIVETVGRVLEQQAFAFADPCTCEELELGADDALRTSMRFDGPQQGMLEAAVPLALAVELAANVLGVEVEDAAAQEMAADAVKELLNVVCGQVLTAMFGTDAVFQLSIPISVPVPAGQWEASPTDDCCVGFLVDEEHPAVFRMTIEGETT